MMYKDNTTSGGTQFTDNSSTATGHESTSSQKRKDRTDKVLPFKWGKNLKLDSTSNIEQFHPAYPDRMKSLLTSTGWEARKQKWKRLPLPDDEDATRLALTKRMADYIIKHNQNLKDNKDYQHCRDKLGFMHKPTTRRTRVIHHMLGQLYGVAEPLTDGLGANTLTSQHTLHSQ